MITKQTIIADVLKEKPDATKILFEYGLHCIGCRISAMETLESGCKAHGITDEKIDEMVKKINEEN